MRIRIWAAAVLFGIARGMSTARREELRDEVRSMFHHGYTGYMTHAYPADELRPVTCGPLWRDPDPANIGVNDIHANVSMTLVDSLSAIALILPEEWPAAVERVAERVSFDQDVKVQVFEMTIRALGALLSTYQRLEKLPSDTRDQARALKLPGKVDVKKHAPKILELAKDLARRLLPAFSSPTGLPYARVNLRKGVEKGESTETCSAGAGSLILEFTLLSRITGDSTYETLAHRAFMAIWNRRTDQDLVGNQIEIAQGRWLPPGVSGIHAGIDSFFEYALKAAIMMDDSAYMDVFHDAYSAIQAHVRTEDGFIYRPVYLRGLKPTSPSFVDSLSAFFPGVMVLAGDIESAIRGHLVFWNIWRRYDAIPESWDSTSRSVGWGGWPGRPEFIESTYYLHRATGDDFYLRVGERVLRDIVRRTITPCGFAGLTNVETGETADRMESFLLSETLKYLYLLFDPSPEPPVSNTVFTTEGHPLSLPANTAPQSASWRASHNREDLYCPVYVPPTIGGIPVGIEGRADYDYARALVFGPSAAGLAAERDLHAWGDGTCDARPAVPRHTIELVLLPAETPPDAPLPAHDPSPGPSKVFQNSEGDWVIADIDGLRLNVRWRVDGFGYDVVSIGPHRVRAGQFVTISDQRMDGYLPAPTEPIPYSVPVVRVAFAAEGKDEVLLADEGATALFGQTFTRNPSKQGWHLDSPIFLAATGADNPQGCAPIARRSLSPKPGKKPFVLLVDRGGCTFVEKAQHAVAAGAAGLLIGDYEADVKVASGEGIVRPSAGDEDEATMHRLSGLAIALIPHGTARLARVLLAATPVSVTATSAEDEHVLAGTKREGRLVVGDHEIVNMRVVGV